MPFDRARLAALDPELLALRARIKPARRMRAQGDAHASELEQRLRAEGLTVLRASRTVYAAHRAVDVHELASLERALERPLVSSRAYARIQRRIGALLGYPPCCVDAFVARQRSAPRSLLTRALGLPDESWRGARAAWVARPDPRLNVLLGGEDARLVAFEPCRLDCPAALAHASDVLATCEAHDAVAARALLRALARDVVIHPSGARAIADVRDGALVHLTPVRRGAGVAVSPTDRAALDALRGLRVRARGRLSAHRLALRPALLLAFGAPPPRATPCDRTSENGPIAQSVRAPRS